MRPMNSLLNWSLNVADVVARIVVLAPVRRVLMAAVGFATRWML